MQDRRFAILPPYPPCGVSRLDSFIRRLEAQRACLDLAARLLQGVEGVVLELGLGNGRTYDHLRELFPERPIHVFERQVTAHPDCVPPLDLLWLGDMRETLTAARVHLARAAALAHVDAGTGEAAANRALAVTLAPLIAPLLCIGGLVVSDQPLDHEVLSPLSLPETVAPGRYHLYRRISR